VASKVVVAMMRRRNMRSLEGKLHQIGVIFEP
jgi:hypothetical protein